MNTTTENSKQTAEGCGEMTNQFCWNELVTKDLGGSKKFYSSLFGWKPEAYGEGVDYTLLKHPKAKADDKAIGGVFHCPDAPATGWLPYVMVDDCDATVRKAKELGAKVAVEAKDVPTVGRIAVIVDPQGAALGIIKPSPHS